MSATYSANHGATTLDLQLKHNWSNPQIALEYIGDSDPHQEKMAAYVQKVPVANYSPISAGPPVSAGPILTRPTNETSPTTFESNASTVKVRKSKLTLGRRQSTHAPPAPPLVLPRCKYYLLLTL